MRTEIEMRVLMGSSYCPFPAPRDPRLLSWAARCSVRVVNTAVARERAFWGAFPGKGALADTTYVHEQRPRSAFALQRSSSPHPCPGFLAGLLLP